MKVNGLNNVDNRENGQLSQKRWSWITFSQFEPSTSTDDRSKFELQIVLDLIFWVFYYDFSRTLEPFSGNLSSEVTDHHKEMIWKRHLLSVLPWNAFLVSSLSDNGILAIVSGYLTSNIWFPQILSWIIPHSGIPLLSVHWNPSAGPWLTVIFSIGMFSLWQYGW